MGFVRLSASGLAIAAAVLGGSTSLAEEAAPKKARTCINRREINTVAALDDAHVFAKLSAGRFHLFTVEKTCQDLRLARQLAFEGTGSRVCDDGSSLVSFSVPPTGPIHCRVERIEKVAGKAEALELIESRAAPE
jgi:hypothetical protein